MILFVTRLSRASTDLNAIYRSITDNFVDWRWCIYTDQIQSPVPNDSRLIVNDSIKKNTKFFVEAIYDAFTSDIKKNSHWIYVLDDDNIVHPELKNVIEDGYDLIISDLKDDRKNSPIRTPRNLSSSYCIGHVDFASLLFSTKYPVIDRDTLMKADISCDGALVKHYIESGAKIKYTNKVAGYYNYLR